jgi:predicted ATPase
LYQNVLYDRISPSRRIQLHRRIGDQGEELYGERASEISAELAMHFERGANYGQAAKYLQHAADNVLRRFAYRESVALSRRGLELIERMPDTAERSKRELGLHITLGAPLIATEGYAAPEVGINYTRALDLCRQLGEAPEFSQALWGLWTFYLVKAELGTARETAREYLRVAEDIPYSWLTMEVTLIHLGEFQQAMNHFEKALLLYDPQRNRDDSFRYSQNSGVASQCHAAWALWFLGHPDQALDRVEKALNLARELSEPHGMAHALFFMAVIHQLRRDESLAKVFAEAAFSISAEHGLLLYQATSTVTRGWTLIELGRADEAIEQIQLGLTGHQATGTVLLRPHFLALLAEALKKAGRIEEGLLVLEDAMIQAHENGDRYYLAEIHRLKGELLLNLANGQDAAAGAESCFIQAVETARKQNSKSLELRAAMSLSRLYRNQKRPKAKNILAEVYGSFTEGFDTKDLQEAKALLEYPS